MPVYRKESGVGVVEGGGGLRSLAAWQLRDIKCFPPTSRLQVVCTTVQQRFELDTIPRLKSFTFKVFPENHVLRGPFKCGSRPTRAAVRTERRYRSRANVHMRGPSRVLPPAIDTY